MMNTSAKRKMKGHSCSWKRHFCIAVIFSSIMIFPAMAVSAAYEDAGILEREIKGRQDVISVKLLGVTEYELTEIFNEFLMGAPGVMEAKRYRFRLDPKRPAGCMVEWQVRTKDTDAFQLENHLYRMLRRAVHSRTEPETPFFTFEPTEEDLRRFKNIMPRVASTREIEFVMGHPWRSESRSTKRTFEAGENWRYRPNSGFE